MSNTQQAVDAINAAWKTEERVKYTFRSPDGEMETMIFEWEEIENGLIRLWNRRGFTLIERRVVNVPVGTNNPPEDVEKIGGFHE